MAACMAACVAGLYFVPKSAQLHCTARAAHAAARAHARTGARTRTCTRTGTCTRSRLREQVHAVTSTRTHTNARTHVHTHMHARTRSHARERRRAAGSCDGGVLCRGVLRLGAQTGAPGATCMVMYAYVEQDR
jgi:hypothetical protein